MFRLTNFKSSSHPLLKDREIELSDPSEVAASNYFTLIIGPNGTGKSNLLKNIIEAFNEICIKQTISDYRSRSRFSVEYQLDGVKYLATADRTLVQLSAYGKMKLPERWLASSVTLNDKYPILNYTRKKQIPQYRYLGIRSASNNAFISRMTVTTVMHFLDALRLGRADKLFALYTSLQLKTEVQIVFVGGPMLKLSKSKGSYRIPEKQEGITKPHRDFISRNRSKTNYRADTYERHIHDPKKIFRVLKFIASRADIFEKTTKSQIRFNYQINLETQQGIESILGDWEVLSVLLDLELIKISRFMIAKRSQFRFEDASSGESHLLGSFHGIIANIADNSLLVIDEPEVSLHPNWQIDYIDILKEMLTGFHGVHTIISTHSHLMVTCLKNEESRIIALRPDTETGKIDIEQLDYETYGWDPESVLYSIFGLVNMRNKYFEMDLRKMIDLMTRRSDDKVQLKQLRDRVAKYILVHEEDPLNLLIAEVDKYLTLN